MFSKVIYIERKRHKLPERRTFRFTGTSQVYCFIKCIGLLFRGMALILTCTNNFNQGVTQTTVRLE